MKQVILRIFFCRQRSESNVFVHIIRVHNKTEIRKVLLGIKDGFFLFKEMSNFVTRNAVLFGLVSWEFK